MSTEIMIRPTIPDEETASQAAAAVEALQRIIEENTSNGILTVKADGSSEATVHMPAASMRLVIGLLEQIAKGSVITVAALDDEITAHQAADLLNVSPPYVEDLLDKGEIPHRLLRLRRRIRVSDLLEYKRIDGAKRRAIADELTREAQELGLYDL